MKIGIKSNVFTNNVTTFVCIIGKSKNIMEGKDT